MPATFRFIRPSDVLIKGFEHATVDHDLIITGSGTFGTNTGDLFFRRDSNPTDSGAQSGSGQAITLRADQKIFIDGRYIYNDIDLNWNGEDAINDTGGTDPVIITNIAGCAVMRQLAINGIRNAKVTGRYVEGVSGHPDFRGHEGVGGVWGRKNSYGIRIENTNYSSQGLVYLRDQYGTFRRTCSDIETEFVEIWGGVTGLQMKADFLNDDGYDSDRGEQTYEDFPTNSIKSSGTMWNMFVHDCYFHDISGEAMYIGHTGATSSQHHSIHFRCWNNIMTRCGREIMQASRLIPNMTNYAIDSNDNVSKWKSRIHNNVMLIGAYNWLRENPDGAANNQDGGFQIGARNGGVEVDHNFIIGGGEFTIFCQQDTNGGLTTGLYAQITNSGDDNTMTHIHHNYLGGSRNDLMYCQNGNTGLGRYIKFDSNYIDSWDFDYDAFYGDSEHSYYITGNDDDSNYIITNNIQKDATKTLIGAFSPVSSKINVGIPSPNNTVNASMNVVGFINSGWDDASKEYARYEHWVDEIGRRAGDGGGTQPGSFRNILTGDTLTVDDGFHYRALSDHQSDTANSEPGIGSAWQTYFERLPFDYFPDDLRVPVGSTYHTEGIGITSEYDEVTTSLEFIGGLGQLI